MASPPDPTIPPAPALALNDDLLAEIFLPLPAPADVVRVSAACVSFRRLVTDRSFLRRFRSLHAPPMLGFLDHRGFYPALPGHPSAPAARAVSLVADLSFSFLPSPGGWILRDVSDGRVLLDRAPEGSSDKVFPIFTELAVCDPLHRRSLVLPPIPDDLAASVEHPRWRESFLAPRGEEEEVAVAEEETSFRVIWMAECKDKLVAFVFSSSTGQWQAGASQRWGDLITCTGNSSWWSMCTGRQFACGCFFWDTDWKDKLLVLDTRRMEFSISDLPPDCHRRAFAIVDAGEGRLGIFVLRDRIADGTVHLCYMIKQDNCDGPHQWQIEKVIPLDPAYRHYIRGSTDTYLLLVRSREGLNSGILMEVTDSECFSLDVKALQLERLCELKHHIIHGFIYTNFPPSLSSETI